MALRSWGVFERPADISKAYGGGKKIGVGGFQEDEEERKRKQKAMEDRLRCAWCRHLAPRADRALSLL